MYSITFQIPLDSYSSLQLTGAYQRLGLPASPGIEHGHYMWAATPRHRAGTIEVIDTSTMIKSFYHSRLANPLVAWTDQCGIDQAIYVSDTTTTTTTTTTSPETTSAPDASSGSTTTLAPTTEPTTTTTTPAPYTKEVISSCPFMFMTDTHSLPILSLVINVDQGNVTSLVWDNQCMTCASNSPECLKGYQAMDIVVETTTVYSMAPIPDGGEYLTGGCGSLHASCVFNAGSTIENVCDPKVLVTFAGTDRNGRQLSTAGLRISQFAGLSISSLWDSVVYSFTPPNVSSEGTVNAAETDLLSPPNL
jgi:hypothetical protein